MVKLECGHYTTEKCLKKDGTCCLECKKCQKVVCMAEKHDCSYRKKVNPNESNRNPNSATLR